MVLFEQRRRNAGSSATHSDKPTPPYSIRHAVPYQAPSFWSRIDPWGLSQPARAGPLLTQPLRRTQPSLPRRTVPLHTCPHRYTSPHHAHSHRHALPGRAKPIRRTQPSLPRLSASSPIHPRRPRSTTLFASSPLIPTNPPAPVPLSPDLADKPNPPGPPQPDISCLAGPSRTIRRTESDQTLSDQTLSDKPCPPSPGPVPSDKPSRVPPTHPFPLPTRFDPWRRAMPDQVRPSHTDVPSRARSSRRAESGQLTPSRQPCPSPFYPFPI